MPDLVQIPYQPECWVTPRLLARLLDACRRAGHNIPINGSDGAWRSAVTQTGFWDAYIAYKNGGPYAPIASSPYPPGQRNHMRAEAVDILYPSRDGQFMAAAGFIRDADEDWHYNDPDWASMPIIPTNTSVAGGGATPVQEDDMSAQAEAEIHAIWEWLGGGKPTTVLYDLQQVIAKVKAVTDQLAGGQGPIHTKLDNLAYITNDPGVGIRTRVASVQAELTKIEAELSSALASLPKSTT